MLNSIITSGLTLQTFLICTAVSLLLGAGCAGVAMYKSRCSQSFAAALFILPAVVQMVIMLVNGSVGTGVAVAGAFSLVRFRSAPGNAREIGVIFLSMAVGLALGMGYVAIAVIFFAIIAAVLLLFAKFGFGTPRKEERTLKITIPENLDYDGLFDDLLKQYTCAYSLENVKTTNMGTLYELRYSIRLKNDEIPKPFIDAIRCRNGNLNVSCSREVNRDSL